uniref:Uncharacterized protein n=1 Tax=Glossina palpalis gambiensis TaxID=67801 RepID=A0A1B0B8S9_9MUSC
MANNALSSQQNKYDRLLRNVAIPENRYRSIDVVFLKHKIRPVPHRLIPQLNRSIHKPSTPKNNSMDSIKMKRDCVNRALSNMMRRPPKREHHREMPDSCKPTVVPSPPPDRDEAAAASHPGFCSNQRCKFFNNGASSPVNLLPVACSTTATCKSAAIQLSSMLR